jgi:hypothetical protein
MFSATPDTRCLWYMTPHADGSFSTYGTSIRDFPQARPGGAWSDRVSKSCARVSMGLWAMLQPVMLRVVQTTVRAHSQQRAPNRTETSAAAPRYSLHFRGWMHMKWLFEPSFQLTPTSAGWYKAQCSQRDTWKLWKGTCLPKASAVFSFRWKNA